MAEKRRPGADIRLYLRLLRYVIPYRRAFALSLLAMAVLAATAPAVAAITRPVLDDLIIARRASMLVWVPVMVIALFTVRAAASFSSVYLLQWVAGRVVMDLREAMFEKVLLLPSAYHDSHTTGGLISKFTYDVTQIKEACTNSVTILVRDSLAVAGLLAWMLYVDWTLTLIAGVGAPLIWAVVIVLRRRLRRMSRKVQDSIASIHHALGEVISAERIIKIHGAREQEAERFHEVADGSRRYMLKLAATAAASGPALELIAAIVLAIIIVAAGRQAVAGQITVGEFASFFGAAALLLGPMKRLARVNEYIQRGLAASESIFGLLDTAGEPDNGAQEIPKLKGGIEIRGLRFGYGDDRDALDEFSLQVSPGETLALVGPSGGGKTTLVNLLPRFYETGEGEILLDGRDISGFSLAALRANIALVSQDIVLFDDTVRNNIAYGTTRNASDAEVIAAAEAANAMEFIRTLPEGLETRIGERGSRLSGGQRQRLALARALLKDAPILILDEATSSVDPESERRILAAIEGIRRGRTCLIVAHRLSTVAGADRVVVIEKGRVVQAGSHRDLIDKPGAYARLHGMG